MGGDTTTERQSRGCSCLLDRPCTGYHSNPQNSSSAVTLWIDRAGEVSPEAEIPPATDHCRTESEGQVTAREVWFLLSEKERQEFGVVFSRMVMRFFHIIPRVQGS